MSAVQSVINEDWKSVGCNTLLGFCRVRFPSGMILSDVAVHSKNGRLWAAPASKPRLGRDGLQMRDADGDALWTPIISFETKAVEDRFSAQVIEALGRVFPNALQAPGGAEVPS